MLCSNAVKVTCCLLILLVLCERNQAAQRLCGKALTEALDVMCRDGFASKIKKSLDLDDYTYNEVEDELPYPYANSPFLAKIHGESANMLAKTRRRRHGVYDECCRKGCNYSELLSYCL